MLSFDITPPRMIIFLMLNKGLGHRAGRRKAPLEGNILLMRAIFPLRLRRLGVFS